MAIVAFLWISFMMKLQLYLNKAEKEKRKEKKSLVG